MPKITKMWDYIGDRVQGEEAKQTKLQIYQFYETF